MDPRHAVLFEPVRIGPKTLPNRFYQVPHASGFGSGQPRTQAAFRGIKAEGGWGGVCVEYAPVSRDSDERPAIAADLWDDRDAGALALTADAVHAHGALAGLELFHGGGLSVNGASRAVRLAPSQLASPPQFASLAKEMTAADIARVQRDWAEAARRARDAGFDIVYVYGAHGYLVTQFLSPVTNRRTDGYGGSLAARGRFWLETLAAVRSAVGADCAVATRVTVHGRDGLPGIVLEEMLELVPARLASGAVLAGGQLGPFGAGRRGAARRAWSAPWCWASAASRPSTWWRRSRRSAAGCAGSGGCRPWATGGGSPTGALCSWTSSPVSR